MDTQSANKVVVNSEKNVRAAILLTFFFGPLGMFYSTIIGAIVMLVVSVIVGIATSGLGILITWPVCIIWAAVAANNYNKNLGVNKNES